MIWNHCRCVCRRGLPYSCQCYYTGTLQKRILFIFNNNTSLPISLAVTPKQWENNSDINIAKAEQQKTNSLSLRALVESLLEQTAADMQKQVDATTAAFQMNVQEIKNAKSQMEDQLAKVGQVKWKEIQPMRGKC